MDSSPATPVRQNGGLNGAEAVATPDIALISEHLADVKLQAEERVFSLNSELRKMKDKLAKSERENKTLKIKLGTPDYGAIRKLDFDDEEHNEEEMLNENTATEAKVASDDPVAITWERGNQDINHGNYEAAVRHYTTAARMLAANHAASEARVSELESELEELTAENRIIRERYEKGREENNQLVQKNQDVETYLHERDEYKRMHEEALAQIQNLQLEWAEKEQSVNDLKTEKDELDERQSEYEKLVDDLNAEKDALQNQVRDYEREIVAATKGFEQRFSEQQDAFDSLQTKLAEAEAELAAARENSNQRDSLMDQVQEFELMVAQKDKLLNENEVRWMEQSSHHQQQLSEASDRQRDLEDQVQTLNEQLKEAQEQSSGLLGDWQQKSEAADAEVVQLQSQINDLNSQLEQMLSEKSLLQETNTKLEEEYNAMQLSNNFEEECKNLRKQCSDLEESERDLCEQVAEQELKLANAADAIKEYIKRVEILENEKNELCQSANQVEVELQEKLQVAEEELEKRKDMLRKLNRRYKKLKGEGENQTEDQVSHLPRLETENRELQNQLAKLREELHELGRKNEVLESEVSRLENEQGQQQEHDAIDEAFEENYESERISRLSSKLQDSNRRAMQSESQVNELELKVEEQSRILLERNQEVESIRESQSEFAARVHDLEKQLATAMDENSAIRSQFEEAQMELAHAMNNQGGSRAMDSRNIVQVDQISPVGNLEWGALVAQNTPPENASEWFDDSNVADSSSPQQQQQQQGVPADQWFGNSNATGPSSPSKQQEGLPADQWFDNSNATGPSLPPPSQQHEGLPADQWFDNSNDPGPSPPPPSQQQGGLPADQWFDNSNIAAGSSSPPPSQQQGMPADQWFGNNGTDNDADGWFAEDQAIDATNEQNKSKAETDQSTALVEQIDNLTAELVSARTIHENLMAKMGEHESKIADLSLALEQAKLVEQQLTETIQLKDQSLEMTSLSNQVIHQGNNTEAVPNSDILVGRLQSELTEKCNELEVLKNEYEMQNRELEEQINTLKSTLIAKDEELEASKSGTQQSADNFFGGNDESAASWFGQEEKQDDELDRVKSELNKSVEKIQTLEQELQLAQQQGVSSPVPAACDELFSNLDSSNGDMVNEDKVGSPVPKVNAEEGGLIERLQDELKMKDDQLKVKDEQLQELERAISDFDVAPSSPAPFSSNPDRATAPGFPAALSNNASASEVFGGESQSGAAYCADDYEKLQNQIDGQLTEIERLENELYEKEEQLANVGTSFEELETLKRVLSEREEKTSQSNNEQLQTLKACIEERDAQLEELRLSVLQRDEKLATSKCEFEESIGAMEKHLVTLDQEKGKLESELKDLQDCFPSVNQAEQKIANLERDLETQKGVIAALQTERDSCLIQTEQAKSELEDTLRRASDAELRVTEFENKISLMQSEQTEAQEHAIADLKAEYTSRLNDLEHQLESAQEKTNTLESKLQRLNNDSYNAEVEKAQLEGKYSDLCEEKDKLVVSMNRVKDEKSKLESEKLRIEGEYASLLLEKSKLKEDVETGRSKNSAVLVECDQLRDKLNEQSDELRSITLQRDQANQQVESFRKLLEERDSQITKKEHEIAAEMETRKTGLHSLQMVIDEHSQMCEKLQVELEQSKQRVSDVHVENVRLNERHEQDRQTINELTAHLDKVEMTNTSLAAANEEYEQQLNDTREVESIREELKLRDAALASISNHVKKLIGVNKKLAHERDHAHVEAAAMYRLDVSAKMEENASLRRRSRSPSPTRFIGAQSPKSCIGKTIVVATDDAVAEKEKTSRIEAPHDSTEEEDWNEMYERIDCQLSEFVEKGAGDLHGSVMTLRGLGELLGEVNDCVSLVNGLSELKEAFDVAKTELEAERVVSHARLMGIEQERDSSRELEEKIRRLEHSCEVKNEIISKYEAELENTAVQRNALEDQVAENVTHILDDRADPHSNESFRKLESDLSETQLQLEETTASLNGKLEEAKACSAILREELELAQSKLLEQNAIAGGADESEIVSALQEQLACARQEIEKLTTYKRESLALHGDIAECVQLATTLQTGAVVTKVPASSSWEAAGVVMNEMQTCLSLAAQLEERSGRLERCEVDESEYQKVCQERDELSRERDESMKRLVKLERQLAMRKSIFGTKSPPLPRGSELHDKEEKNDAPPSTKSPRDLSVDVTNETATVRPTNVLGLRYVPPIAKRNDRVLTNVSRLQPVEQQKIPDSPLVTPWSDKWWDEGSIGEYDGENDGEDVVNPQQVPPLAMPPSAASSPRSDADTNSYASGPHSPPPPINIYSPNGASTSSAMSSPDDSGCEIGLASPVPSSPGILSPEPGTPPKAGTPPRPTPPGGPPGMGFQQEQSNSSPKHVEFQPTPPRGVDNNFGMPPAPESIHAAAATPETKQKLNAVAGDEPVKVSDESPRFMSKMFGIGKHRNLIEARIKDDNSDFDEEDDHTKEFATGGESNQVHSRRGSDMSDPFTAAREIRQRTWSNYSQKSSGPFQQANTYPAYELQPRPSGIIAESNTPPPTSNEFWQGQSGAPPQGFHTDSGSGGAQPLQGSSSDRTGSVPPPQGFHQESGSVVAPPMQGSPRIPADGSVPPPQGFHSGGGPPPMQGSPQIGSSGSMPPPQGFHLDSGGQPEMQPMMYDQGGPPVEVGFNTNMQRSSSNDGNLENSFDSSYQQDLGPSSPMGQPYGENNTADGLQWPSEPLGSPHPPSSPFDRASMENEEYYNYQENVVDAPQSTDNCGPSSPFASPGDTDAPVLNWSDVTENPPSPRKEENTAAEDESQNVSSNDTVEDEGNSVDFKGRCAILEEEKQKLEAKVADLEEQLEMERDSRIWRERQNCVSETQLQKSIEENEELRYEFSLMKSELEAARSDLENKTHSLSNVAGAHEADKSELNRALNRVSSLQMELDQCRFELQQAQQNVSQLTASLNAATTQSKLATQEMETLSHRLAEREKDYTYLTKNLSLAIYARNPNAPSTILDTTDNKIPKPVISGASATTTVVYKRQSKLGLITDWTFTFMLPHLLLVLTTFMLAVGTPPQLWHDILGSIQSREFIPS